jgi:hypothetical protein
MMLTLLDLLARHYTDASSYPRAWQGVRGPRSGKLRRVPLLRGGECKPVKGWRKHEQSLSSRASHSAVLQALHVVVADPCSTCTDSHLRQLDPSTTNGVEDCRIRRRIVGC